MRVEIFRFSVDLFVTQDDRRLIWYRQPTVFKKDSVGFQSLIFFLDKGTLFYTMKTLLIVWPLEVCNVKWSQTEWHYQVQYFYHQTWNGWNLLQSFNAFNRNTAACKWAPVDNGPLLVELDFSYYQFSVDDANFMINEFNALNTFEFRLEKCCKWQMLSNVTNDIHNYDVQQLENQQLCETSRIQIWWFMDSVGIKMLIIYSTKT